jgi:hypothetical protein
MRTLAEIIAARDAFIDPARCALCQVQSRTAPDPLDRMATAIHDSGHGVVAMSLSLEVTRVTLEAGFLAPAGWLGVCCTRHGDDPNSYWAAAVMGLAGPVAEQKFARYPPDTLAMMWHTRGRRIAPM